MSIICDICGKPATQTGPGSKMYVVANADQFGRRDTFCVMIESQEEYGLYRLGHDTVAHLCGRCVEKMRLKQLSKESEKRRKEREKQRQIDHQNTQPEAKQQ